MPDIFQNNFNAAFAGVCVSGIVFSFFVISFSEIHIHLVVLCSFFVEALVALGYCVSSQFHHKRLFVGCEGLIVIKCCKSDNRLMADVCKNITSYILLCIGKNH